MNNIRKYSWVLFIIGYLMGRYAMLVEKTFQPVPWFLILPFIIVLMILFVFYDRVYLELSWKDCFINALLLTGVWMFFSISFHF